MIRKDVGRFLLQKYCRMSMTDFNPLWTSEKRGDFVFRFYYIELFLVQQQSIQSMDATERKLLLKETILKYELKESRGDLFGGMSLVTSPWILAKTLHTENILQANFSTPSSIERSLQSGIILDFDIQSIFQQAKRYADE